MAGAGREKTALDRAKGARKRAACRAKAPSEQAKGGVPAESVGTEMIPADSTWTNEIPVDGTRGDMGAPMGNGRDRAPAGWTGSKAASQDRARGAKRPAERARRDAAPVDGARGNGGV